MGISWGSRLRTRVGVAGALAAVMVLSGLTPVLADGLTGVAGQVVQEDGTAVPGATVTATPDDGAGGEAVSTTTDGAGRYSLDTRAGGHRLRVVPGEATPELAAREVPVAVEAGRRTVRDVVLSSPNLSGVVRGADGTPLAGARVKVWQYSYSTTELVTETGADGSYSMRVGTGDLTVWAEPPPTLAPHTHAMSTRHSRTVPLTGGLSGVVLDLRPVAITGQVLAPGDRTPVVGARLEIEGPRQPNGSTPSESVVTGADGTFAAAMAATGTVSIVARPALANPGGWGQTKLTVQHDGPGATDVGEILLDGNRNVSGRVVGPGGEGVAGAELTFAGWDVDNEFVHVTAVADATGAYRAALPRSETRYGYSVEASAPGETNELLPAQGPRFFVGTDPVSLPDVVLAAPNLRGVAREPVTGDPLRGIEVRVLDSHGNVVGSSTTDGTGLFGLVVPAGSYQLVPEVPRDSGRWIRSSTPATVTDGATTSVDVTFRLAPPAPYALADLPLPPIEGLEVLSHSELPPSMSADGRYAVYGGVYQDEGAPPDCSGEVCVWESQPRPLFRADLATGEVVRVDLSASGAPADDVRAAAVASSGEVVFVSDTDGLVDGDADEAADVFLHDPRDGTTVQLSDEPVRSRSWMDWQDDVDSVVSISADGSRVAWAEPSYVTLGEGADAYDVESGKAVVLEVATATRREFPEALVAHPVLSADGSTLAYTSHMGSWEYDPEASHSSDNPHDTHRTQLEVVDLTAADNDSDAVFEVYDGWDSPWFEENPDLPAHSYPSLTDDGETLAYVSYADPCAECGSDYAFTANVVEWRAPETARQVDPFAGHHVTTTGPERVVLNGSGTTLAVLGAVSDYDETAENSSVLWRYDLARDELALVSQDDAGTLGTGAWDPTLQLSPRPFNADASLAVFGVSTRSDVGVDTVAYVGRVPETDPPTWPEPAGVTVSDIGTASLRLTWTAATDETGLAGYRVYRDGSRVADVPASHRSTVLTGLSPATTYDLVVQAYDSAGNESSDGPSTTATTLDSSTTELLPLSAQLSGGAVVLGWDPAPPTAEGLVVRRAVNGGAQSDLVSLPADAVSYRDGTAPASASVDYQVWSTDAGGAARPFTTVASVTTPELTLSSVDWSAPSVATGQLRLHGDLVVTLRGSPGRAASALVGYTSWYVDDTLRDAPAAAQALLPLAEVSGSPGVYRGTFPLAEGIASITGITGQLSDGGDSELTRQAPRLPVAVSGAVRAVPSSGDPLSGTGLTVVSASTGFGARQTMAGDAPVTFSGAPAGDDFVVEAREGDWLAGRATGVVVRPGRTTEVPLAVVLPSTLAVTVDVPGDAAPPGFSVQVVDRVTGSVLLTRWTSGGRARLGPLPSGSDVRVRVVPPASTDFLPLSQDLVLERGENALSFDAAPPATGTVAGVVRVSGEPAADARVTLVHYVDGRSRTAHATTGEDGSYSLQGYVGEATVSAVHRGVAVPAASVTVPAGATLTHDMVVPVPTPREVLVELRTRHSVEDEWSAVTVDWRTAIHFGRMEPRVNGGSRPYAWKLDEASGRNLLLIDARDGETIRLCANAHEVGLGSACAEAVFAPDADAVLRLDIGPQPIVRGRVVDQAGTPVTGPYALTRVEPADSPRVDRGWSRDGSVVSEVRDGDGQYVLSVATEAGRVARTFTVSGADIDLGELVLRAPTTFTSDLNLLRSVDPVARPGQLLTLEAHVSNDGDAALDAVSARLELPPGVVVQRDGVLVDGEGVAAAEGTRTVALGRLEPGQLLRLRVTVLVPSDYKASSLPVAVVLLAEGVEDHLPDVVVPVERLSINPIPVLGSATFPIGGSAPPGAQVTVRDGATVVGTAAAGVGGRWRTTVTVVNEGFPSRHAMTATAVSGDEVLVASELVSVDTTRPVPSSATLAQGSGRDRRSHTFDPRQGPAEFVFTWAPGQPVELKATFAEADRLRSAAFYVGDERIPASVGAGGTVSASRAIRRPGDIYVETELSPPTASAAMPPSPSSPMGEAAARLPGSFSGFGVQVLRETEQEVDLEFTLPALDGAKATASVRAEYLPAYEPTPEDLERASRTGRNVYGLSATFSGDSLTMQVVLPKSEVERLGGSLPSSGSSSGSLRRSGSSRGLTASSALPQATQEAIKLGFTLSTGGWDIKSAWGADSKYAELGKLLDQLEAMNCNEQFNAKWLAEINSLGNWMLAADAGAAILTVAGAVAGAFTAGAGALAVWAAGLVIGLMVDDVIADEVEDMKRRMAQESNECFRPKRKQIARPTWIIDPSGYVFEGLRTRRVSDVTATLLHGPSENGPWSLAEMEQYGQQNPVQTDGQGRYGWDVPQGWWKVQYTKDGYEPAFSRPLQVLPPHLDVDQNLVRLDAPEVAAVAATPERSFRLRFTHLMRVPSVGPAVVLRDASGNAVPATVTAVDAATDDGGVPLSDTFLVAPTDPAPDGRYTVEVPAEVQNYAGRLMAAAAVFPVELSTPSDPLPTPSASPSVTTPPVSSPSPSTSSGSGGGSGGQPGPIGPQPGTPVQPVGSPSATPTPSGSPAASPGSSTSPPSGPPVSPTSVPDCGSVPEVELLQSTIVATGAAGVVVRGAPGAVVDLLAYTRPSTTYRVVRTARLDAAGVATFRVVPPANTRLHAQQRGCAAGPSVVLNVRTALTLTAERVGRLTYRFAGDSLPARPAGLIVSLYRVTADGRQVLTAQTRADATDGEWSIDRRFLGGGRFGFVVRTGQDLQNAPGASNVRPTVLH